MIYLIRHTQSEANAKRIAGGDYPLSEKGINDAEELRKQLNLSPDLLVSSPLIRARQTARILFPEKEIIIDDAFREIHFGDYENTPMENNEFLQIYNTFPSRLHEITHGDVIKERADKAIIKLLDYLSEGETVVVCHDTLMRAVICRLKGESLDNMPKYKPLLTNGSMLSVSFASALEITNDSGKIII